MSHRTTDDMPAFPGPNTDDLGMTLRDWFAGQAIIHISTLTPVEVAAQMAYQLADAMMKEREKP